KEVKLGYSKNHGKEGQNVLYADASLRVVNSPCVGPQRDNIVTAQDRSSVLAVDQYLRSYPPGRLPMDESGDASLTGDSFGAMIEHLYASPGSGNDSFLVPVDDWAAPDTGA